jgi:hypothetical protein
MISATPLRPLERKHLVGCAVAQGVPLWPITDTSGAVIFPGGFQNNRINERDSSSAPYRRFCNTAENRPQDRLRRKRRSKSRFDGVFIDCKRGAAAFPSSAAAVRGLSRRILAAFAAHRQFAGRPVRIVHRTTYDFCVAQPAMQSRAARITPPVLK